MNNARSLSMVLEDDRCITALVLSIPSASLKMKTLLLELLAAVCFVPPDGLQLVLAGFSAFQSRRNERFRFETFLTALRTAGNVDFQITGMILCNAIVNSSNDLEFRIHLRNELLDLGIEEAIHELRAPDDDDLNTQLNVFEDEAVADDEAIADRYGVMSINMTDPEEIFHAIRSQASDSSSAAWFLKSIQQLMLIPNSRKYRIHYWRLIYTVITQIVLQREGHDPDVSYFDINVEEILAGFIGQEEFEKTKQVVTELEKQIISLDRDLKKTQETLRDTEALLQRTTDELRQAQHTAMAAMEKIKQSGEESAPLRPDIFKWDEIKFPLGMKVSEDTKTVFKNFVHLSMEKALEHAREESKKKTEATLAEIEASRASLPAAPIEVVPAPAAP